MNLRKSGTDNSTLETSCTLKNSTQKPDLRTADMGMEVTEEELL